MEKINDSNIILSKEIYESDFYYGLLEEEFQKILSNKEFECMHIHMYNAYVYENEDYIEMGIYFINTSEKDLIINSLPLSVYNNEEKILNFNIEINKTLAKNAAIFKEVKIAREELKGVYDSESFDLDNLSVAIDGYNNIKKYPYINIEIDNLPKIKEYTNYRDMKRFIKELPLMEENQLTIDIFRVGEFEEGFYIIALFRNSSDRDIRLKSIPITVHTENDLLAYKGVFKPKEDSILIPSNKGKMMVIVIPPDQFPIIESEDLSKYKVEIK